MASQGATLKRLILIILYFATSHCWALDFPLLRLSKDGHSIFLVGSSHIGLQGATPIKDVETLLTHGTAVCMENDPSDTQSAIRTAQAVFTNPPGIQLKERIGTALYEASKAQLRGYLSTGASIDELSPYALSSLLSMNMPHLGDFMAQLKPEYSLDEALRQTAARMHQPLRTIEDSNAVSAAFSSLTDNEWREFVSETLEILRCKECRHAYGENMIHAYDASTDFEAAHWRVTQAFGDHARLFALFEKLFYDQRNVQMAKNIEHAALGNQQCSVVAIGAGHLGGPMGVVARLRANGVRVDSLNTVEEALRQSN